MMKKIIITSVSAIILSGCLDTAVMRTNIPQPTMARSNPYERSVAPLYIDYVNLRQPFNVGKQFYSTPLDVGITASNSCAYITSKSWHRDRDGFNVSLRVKEMLHTGYRCNKTPSRLQASIVLPYQLQTGRPYTFQVIINGQPKGVVETTIRKDFSPGAASLPVPRYR